jgi:OOP family OmpA-OmpF porin
MVLALPAIAVQAQVKDVVLDQKGVLPYAIDQRGVIARSGVGLCWRTGYWTPQLAAETPVVGSEFPAGCECDKDLMPKEKCEPKPVPVAAPPAPPPPPPAPKAITLAAKALFDFDKAVLKPGGKEEIDREVIAKLEGLDKVEFMTVSGHTDRLGSNTYNQKLSERRAEAVKAYLVSKGIAANNIETFGYGKTQPVAGVTCDDKLPRKKLIECLAPHRRVVIEVKGPTK